MKKPGCSHTGRESCADSGASSAFPCLGSEHPPESARSAEEMPGSAVIFCMCDVSILPEVRRWRDYHPSASSAQPQNGCPIAQQWRCAAVCHRWYCCLSWHFEHFKTEIRGDKEEQTDAKHTTQCRYLTLYRMS